MSNYQTMLKITVDLSVKEINHLLGRLLGEDEGPMCEGWQSETSRLLEDKVREAVLEAKPDFEFDYP